MKRIKNFFKRYYNLIVSKFKQRKNKSNLEAKIREAKIDFETKLNVNLDEVIDIMYSKAANRDDYERLNFLNEELIKGRAHILNIHKYVSKTPYLYEPDVVDIHNEHCHNNTVTLNEIIKRENDSTSHSLKQQLKKYGEFMVDSSTPSIRSRDVKTHKNIEDLSLNDIRNIKSEEDYSRFGTIENQLKSFSSINHLKANPIDMELPPDINIDDFPTLKKIMGKR